MNPDVSSVSTYIKFTLCALVTSLFSCHKFNPRGLHWTITILNPPLVAIKNSVFTFLLQSVCCVILH